MQLFYGCPFYCFTDLVKAHNEEFSDIDPNHYIWEMHYKHSIYKIRERAKLAIKKAAQEVSFRANRNGDPWRNYLKLTPFLATLHSFEIKHEQSVIILRPFIKDFVAEVLIELQFKSPIQYQHELIQSECSNHFESFEVGEFFSFNLPFQEWLSSLEKEFNYEERLSLVDDLMEMRSIFYKNWDAEKHRIEINGELDGIIDLQSAIPSISIIPKEWVKHDRKTLDTVAWCIHSGTAFFQSSFFSSFGLKADFLLELVHDYIVALFLKVKNNPHQNNIDFQEFTINIFYDHLEKDNYTDQANVKLELELEAQNTKTIHIPKVRQNRLFVWLQDQLKCQILSGKGSEIKIFYPGGRIYTLGKHKPNPEVSTWKIKEILKRVGINESIWIPLVKYL
ncbi:hypothetical protein WN093_12640 [Gammaproteobacteria bacterium AS21]